MQTNVCKDVCATKVYANQCVYKWGLCKPMCVQQGLCKPTCVQLKVYANQYMYNSGLCKPMCVQQGLWNQSVYN